MLTFIYRGIIALVAAMVVWNLFVPENAGEKELSRKEIITSQLNSAMVLIPLLMRLLMIK